jgi:hypothetical protein
MNNIKYLGLFSPGRYYKPGLKIPAQARGGEATWYPLSHRFVRQQGLKVTFSTG